MNHSMLNGNFAPTAGHIVVNCTIDTIHTALIWARVRCLPSVNKICSVEMPVKLMLNVNKAEGRNNKRGGLCRDVTITNDRVSHVYYQYMIKEKLKKTLISAMGFVRIQINYSINNSMGRHG